MIMVMSMKTSVTATALDRSVKLSISEFVNNAYCVNYIIGKLKGKDSKKKKYQPFITRPYLEYKRMHLEDKQTNIYAYILYECFTPNNIYP